MTVGGFPATVFAELFEKISLKDWFSLVLLWFLSGFSLGLSDLELYSFFAYLDLMVPLSPRRQLGSDDPKLFMSSMAVSVAFPFRLSPCSLWPESTLEQGLFSYNCLLAL